MTDLDKNAVIQEIQAECIKQGLTLPAQIAYVLATADHETNHTFRPVREAYWLKDNDKYLKSKQYYPFVGMGYVQLTWKANYEKYGRILGIDLVGNPELALKHEVALFVLVHGLLTGGFTGRRLDQYVNAKFVDFVNARRCVNGIDKAEEIAALARGYQTMVEAKPLQMEHEVVKEDIKMAHDHVHVQLRELAQLIWDNHGICVQSVKFAWTDASSYDKIKMIVNEIQVDTLVKC